MALIMCAPKHCEDSKHQARVAPEHCLHYLFCLLHFTVSYRQTKKKYNSLDIVIRLFKFKATGEQIHYTTLLLCAPHH